MHCQQCPRHADLLLPDTPLQFRNNSSSTQSQFQSCDPKSGSPTPSSNGLKCYNDSSGNSSSILGGCAYCKASSPHVKIIDIICESWNADTAIRPLAGVGIAARPVLSSTESPAMESATMNENDHLDGLDLADWSWWLSTEVKLAKPLTENLFTSLCRTEIIDIEGWLMYSA